MDIVEWKRRLINHFQSGVATPPQWEQMASVMLLASEDGDLLADDVGLDDAIDTNREVEFG